MGTGFFVRLNPETTSIDLNMDGRALALNDGALTARCEELKVRPILNFLSPDAETLRGVLDSAGMYDVPIPPEAWFSPAEGLQTLTSLLPLVEAEREWFSHPDALLADLRRIQDILVQAAAAGAEWNLDAEL